MSRYQRQSMLPEIGESGQQRLAQARVLVIGAGGLGSALLPLLAAAGAGYLRLYDGDRVEEHNLHRQTLYGMQDIGEEKVFCARRALATRNPACVVDARPHALTASATAAALDGIDLAI
ncbi:ThiF family adenylyltransferase, partial [Erwinia amylovora]